MENKLIQFWSYEQLFVKLRDLLRILEKEKINMQTNLGTKDFPHLVILFRCTNKSAKDFFFLRKLCNLWKSPNAKLTFVDANQSK